MTHRVLIAEENVLLRDGLHAIISLTDDLTEVAEAGGGTSLLPAIRRTSPQAVVIMLTARGKLGQGSIRTVCGLG